MICAPLRSRFGIDSRLDYYTAEELQKIVLPQRGPARAWKSTRRARWRSPRRSRGTPRIANNLLRWVRDYAQVKASGTITRDVADQRARHAGDRPDGFDEMDKRILEALIQKFGGGPVGVNSLAVAVGEEAGTLEDVHEPYLIMQGYLKRTAQGRVAMPRAYEKLGSSHRENDRIRNCSRKSKGKRGAPGHPTC